MAGADLHLLIISLFESELKIGFLVFLGGDNGK